MNVYFISGLAADKRIFRHIQLPAGFEAVYLDWIQPLEDETLPGYALRLAANINRNEPFVLVGLSFGGMLATEIAKQYQPAATILISSVPLSGQLPGYYRIGQKLNLHKLLPVSLIKTASTIKRFFTREHAEDKKLLWQIIHESDVDLIRWSLNAILNWQNDIIPQPVWHIHGKNDEILPVRYTNPTHTIPKEGHMLVMTRPDAVNEIIAKALRVCALNNKYSC